MISCRTFEPKPARSLTVAAAASTAMTDAWMSRSASARDRSEWSAAARLKLRPSSPISSSRLVEEPGRRAVRGEIPEGLRRRRRRG